MRRVGNRAVIIGGGLAGGAVAARLAARGLGPILLEREDTPHDKICGEFLSGEAVAALAGLGVDARALGAVPITRVEINAGRRQADQEDGAPAASIHRRSSSASAQPKRHSVSSLASIARAPAKSPRSTFSSP